MRVWGERREGGGLELWTEPGEYGFRGFAKNSNTHTQRLESSQDLPNLAPPCSCPFLTGPPPQKISDHGVVMTGCSGSAEWLDSTDAGAPVRLSKWLVDVHDSDLKGLFYRSSPGVVVADADWPRNGEVVVGAVVDKAAVGEQAGEGR